MPKRSEREKFQELLRTNKPESLDKLDRIRAYWLGDLELTPKELDMLDKYRKAFGLYCTDNSKSVTLAAMSTELKLSESQCYRILDDAIKLFGDALKHDKAGEKMASREHYIRIAKAAEKAKDYQSAYRARMQADKIIGLFDADESKVPSSILFPATTFVFVDDAEVLKKQQTEDIDHDIVE